MGKPKTDPVVGFVKVVYGKRAGDKRIRREGEKALARQGMRVVFEDEGEGRPVSPLENPDIRATTVARLRAEVQRRGRAPATYGRKESPMD